MPTENLTAVVSAVHRYWPISPEAEAKLSRTRGSLRATAQRHSQYMLAEASRLADDNYVEESWVLQGILDGAEYSTFEADDCEYLNYRLMGFRLARTNPAIALRVLSHIVQGQVVSARNLLVSVSEALEAVLSEA
jgi:hypothetical protein